MSGLGNRSTPWKLSAEIVADFRRRYAKGDVLFQELADEVGVSRQAVQQAVTGQTWGHLDGALPVGYFSQRDLPRKLSPAQEAEIVASYKAGRSSPELGATYGVSGSAIIATLERAGVPRHRRGNPNNLVHQRGEANHSAKLTVDDVRTIRATYANGAQTQTALAARYGVSLMTINFVVRRHTWRHVD